MRKIAVDQSSSSDLLLFFMVDLPFDGGNHLKAANLKPGMDLSVLSDGGQVSVWAKGGVAALVAQGIIKGYEDGSFKPQNPATRAEAVTIIMNSLK